MLRLLGRVHGRRYRALEFPANAVFQGKLPRKEKENPDVHIGVTMSGKGYEKELQILDAKRIVFRYPVLVMEAGLIGGG